jgi:hypothetical protein
MGASIAPPAKAQNVEKKRNFLKIFAAEKACWGFFTIALPHGCARMLTSK